MFIDINPSSGVPIYRQIVDQVKVAIATGKLQRGDRILSVRALSEALLVNPTTVQRAYLDLERDGVTETRRGQGTFVLAELAALPDAERERRVRELLTPVFTEAQRVGLSESELSRIFREQARRFYRPGEPPTHG